MGDTSLPTIDPQSLHDNQMHEETAENHAGQNQMNFSPMDQERPAKDVAPSGKMATLPEPSELTSSEDGDLSTSELRLDTVPQKNGFHIGMDKEIETHSRDSCMLESDSTCKQQLESEILSETAQVEPASVYENGNVIGNGHEIKEEVSNAANFRDSSSRFSSPQEGTQEATEEGTRTQLPEDVHDFRVPEKPLNDGMEPEFHVVDRDCQSTDTENREGADAGSIKAPSDSEQTEHIYFNEDKGGLEKGGERLDESHNGVKSPDRLTGISLEGFSHDDAEVLISPTANESHAKNQITTEAGIPEGLLPHTSEFPTVLEREADQSFDTSMQTGKTALVSSDMEGWQRFDIEENDVKVARVDGTSDQRLELWEQLLEDGLEVTKMDVQNPFLHGGGVVGLESSLHEGNQFGLASPGNPFIEGLDRMSNFSEAEGFIFNGNLPSSRLSHSFEIDTSLHAKEGPFHIANGMPQDTAKSVEEKLTSQLEAANKHGSKPSYPSFSDIRRSSLDSMEPFEAPSFMSLVDPESNALFKASMPAYQACYNVYGHESGGDKWEANFDLMVPPAQEITRSLSLPRVAGEVQRQGQGQGQSFSFFSKKGQITTAASNRGILPPIASPRSKPSGLLSPKLSPLVKKVVDKVRTTPVVANEVLNTVRQVMSPKTADNKTTQKSIWTRCICC